MSTVFGLLAALAFGVADFIAGAAARKVNFLIVTVAIQAIGALSACAVAAATQLQLPSTVSLLWGAVSGVGSATGTLFLYRGLSRGDMTVAAPLSAVGSAAIPVIIGFVLGDRLTLLALAGVVLALPGIWFIAKPSTSTTRSGTLDGLIAGAGFAILFVSLHQVENSGLWPVAAGQIMALIIVTVTTVIIGPPIRQRAPLFIVWLIAAAGVLSITATITYFFATQTGLLTITAVLTALYPGVTVVLAGVILHERPRRGQIIGLAVSGLAVTAISLG